jgi:hypothetical protein
LRLATVNHLLRSLTLEIRTSSYEIDCDRLHWTAVRLQTRILYSLCRHTLRPYSGPAAREARQSRHRKTSQGLCRDIKGGTLGWFAVHAQTRVSPRDTVAHHETRAVDYELSGDAPTDRHIHAQPGCSDITP